ncbi:MAG: phosphopantetheine-binding protein [Thermoanaerobaculia bacterium]|nr:phosphopantetheine-binding protein [Thermoanaerobaculia bacterium]
MSEAPQDLKVRIKKMLVERLKLEVDPAAIEDDAPLFSEQGLGLDSIDALELVLGVEQELGVRIDDEEVGSKAFASVSALAAFVDERIQSGV